MAPSYQTDWYIVPYRRCRSHTGNATSLRMFKSWRSWIRNESMAMGRDRSRAPEVGILPKERGHWRKTRTAASWRFTVLPSSQSINQAFKIREFRPALLLRTICKCTAPANRTTRCLSTEYTTSTTITPYIGLRHFLTFHYLAACNSCVLRTEK